MYLRHQAALVGEWQPSLKPSQLHCQIRRRQRPRSQPPTPPPLLARNFHASKPTHFLSQTSTEYAYNTLTFIHDYSGLPWGLSIPVTAILLQSLITLPTYYLIFLNKRKMDMGDPLRIAYRNALLRKVKEAAKQAEQNPPSRIEAMRKRGNSRATMFFSRKFRYYPCVAMLPVLYVPVWFNFLYVLAGMSGRWNPSPEKNGVFPAPSDSSLASEGLLWFPDLTAFDPFLPVVFFYLLIANAAFGRYQAWTLVDIFPTTHGWTRVKYWFYHRSSIFLQAVFVSGVIIYQPPAALVLFWVSSSACALVQRRLMRRWIGQSKNTIMPARPREMQMRTVVANDAHGIPSYGQSSLVPKEFEDMFGRTQSRPSPGRTPLTSDPAQSFAPRPSDRV